MPLRGQDRIVIGHGGGGQLTAELIEHLFLPAFGDAARAATPTDSAILSVDGQQLAFTTDSYVVRPLFFPGGNIGELAVYGTVNDLAMSGAVPLALSTAFVLEEGLELEVLARVARSMGEAALRANVQLVTGDTKVVDAGLADGMYITTAGVGVLATGIDIRPDRATAGDRIIVSGPIGLHGTAVMSVREGLEFASEIRSDTAPLHDLVQSMLDVCPDIHVLRDLTRSGLAGALCDIAETAKVGVLYHEDRVPVPSDVRAACTFLGLDPIHVANEGKLIAVVPAENAGEVVTAMRNHEIGQESEIIGEITDRDRGYVVARTPIGASRIVVRPLGEQLPRIC